MTVSVEAPELTKSATCSFATTPLRSRVRRTRSCVYVQRHAFRPAPRDQVRTVVPAQAVAPVPEAAPRPTQVFDDLRLTDRERDVAELAVSGLSYAQIARDLFVTQSTVSYHLSNIYAKCNVRTRHELTELVRRPAPVAAW